MLGYGRRDSADRTAAVEPSVRMIAAPDPFQIVSEEELLLGIPREFIRSGNERARIDCPAQDKPWQQLSLDARGVGYCVGLACQSKDDSPLARALGVTPQCGRG